MTGRASVFSDPEVIATLKENFINVAADVNYLQHQQDAEGKFFRKIAEQGHYAGRTKPTTTRQGLYVATADGDLLASVNANSARRVLAMIQKSLNRWDQQDGETTQPLDVNRPDKRFYIAFPDGGLILRETMRDLPRRDDPDFETWRHNFDHVWLTARELKSFIPKSINVGDSYEIPNAVVRRIAAFHFVDQVKGEADAWNRDHVESATLTAEVVSLKDDTMRIKLSGNAKCTQPPTRETNPYSGSRVDQERGVELVLSGWVEFDTVKSSFKRFDLIAAGKRWGAATYNFRARDLGPAPIGFAFELIPTKPENKTRPKFLLWNYFD